jgi:hypothetical protein
MDANSGRICKEVSGGVVLIELMVRKHCRVQIHRGEGCLGSRDNESTQYHDSHTDISASTQSTHRRKP